MDSKVVSYLQSRGEGQGLEIAEDGVGLQIIVEKLAQTEGKRMVCQRQTEENVNRVEPVTKKREEAQSRKHPRVVKVGTFLHLFLTLLRGGQHKLHLPQESKVS
jgi:hypothetical protein